MLCGVRARHGRAAPAAVLAFLTACLALPAQADAETRSLKLYYLHTGEKAIIAFKKDGKYISSGLQKINHFLRDWRRNEPTKMDPHLMDLVWEVYQLSGSKDYIHVVSGYRSPTTNAMLRSRGRGVAKFSQHMLGKAMDFFLPDVKLSRLRELGLKAGVGGVGFYPTSGSPFVHLDTGSVRHWPRMSRQQLVKVFPDGKTMHVPTDGKPLPGYEVALAAYKARQANGGTTALASAEKKNKKDNFFGRLFASARQEQEEDEEANSVPGPRTVRTSATGGDGGQLRPAELTAAPSDQATREELESGTPLQIADEPQEVPIERQLAELAYIPVPEPRPEFERGAIPASLFAEKLRPNPGAQAGNSVVAALTADDIESMRRSAAPAPRPLANVGGANVGVANIGGADAVASRAPGEALAFNAQLVDRDVAREAVMAALNAKRPGLPGNNVPLPQTAPMTVASILPQPDPRRAAAPRTLELALAATETRSNSAGEAIRSLIEADTSLRNARGNGEPGLNVGEIRPTASGDIRPRQQLASAQSYHSDDRAVSSHANRGNSDWVMTGSTVLAGFRPIEHVAYIRAPAYGMGMLRASPREILSAGFVRTAFVQPTRHFSSIANAIPIFDRYED